MPNYFSRLHIVFHDIDEQTVKRLKRFVYAYVDRARREKRSIYSIFFSYDGHVDPIIDPNTTTHILTTSNCHDLLALQDACPQASILNIEWLDACLTNQSKLNPDPYKL